MEIGTTEFVSLLLNSEVIFTDSFHGAVFYIIPKDICSISKAISGKVWKNVL